VEAKSGGAGEAGRPPSWRVAHRSAMVEERSATRPTVRSDRLLFCDEDLKQKLEIYGKITSVKQPRYKNNGKKQGFAFVEFEDYDSVDKAVQTKKFTIKGKAVTVQKAR
jgi:hypothetical protein